MNLAMHRSRHLTDPVSPARIRAVAFAALLAGSVDLLFCLAYWGARGAAPESVFVSVARWVVDDAPRATLGTALLAWGTLVALYLLPVVALDAWIRRVGDMAVSTRIAAAWGVLTYVLLFQIVAPLLAYPLPLNASREWLASAAALHAAVIGPLLAWTLRGARPG